MILSHVRVDLPQGWRCQGQQRLWGGVEPVLHAGRARGMFCMLDVLAGLASSMLIEVLRLYVDLGGRVPVAVSVSSRTTTPNIGFTCGSS